MKKECTEIKCDVIWDRGEPRWIRGVKRWKDAYICTSCKERLDNEEQDQKAETKT